MDPLQDTTSDSGAGKAYSLRPRAAARRGEALAEPDEPWRPRGRSRKKPKQKTLPLSKYRRKTANARERFRMRELNEAFEALRGAVPHLSASCDNPCEKLTKISTLRLAMKYITALSSSLQDSDLDSDAESLLGEWTSPPPPRGASTPSSLDHSDLYDQFFSSSPSSESSSYSLSGLLTPSSCEPAQDLKSNLSSTALASQIFRCSLTPEGSLGHPLLPPGDLHLQGVPTSLLEELDSLPSPAVDLDEYLIT